MLDLVQEASRALSAHDAEALERLAAEARTRVHFGSNIAELARATEVLTAQVYAAKTHLALSSRMQQASSSGWKAAPWAR
jgi:hypothetical protein